MAAPSFRLSGVQYVTPLRQGDLSNLCGLYSVVNAVQLACWRLPPTNDQLRDLLAFGFWFLTKRRSLPRVINSGMDQDVWSDLGTALISHTNDILGTSLAIRRIAPSAGASQLLSGSDVVRMLKEALFQDRPVLCGLEGAMNHYTVLAGYTELRLKLHDSSGLHWLSQHSVGASKTCGKRHWLYPDSANVIVDEW